jgi:hypothetical protein
LTRVREFANLYLVGRQSRRRRRPKEATVSTSTPFAVSFPNIPDAGARPFDTLEAAAAFAARAGFHAIVTDAAGAVVARNGSMGGPVVAVEKGGR